MHFFENKLTSFLSPDKRKVFKDGNKYSGYAMLAKSFSTEFGKNCIWIEDLYVLPSARSHGIGRAFFEFVRKKYPDCVLRLEVEKESHCTKSAVIKLCRIRKCINPIKLKTALPYAMRFI